MRSLALAIALLVPLPALGRAPSPTAKPKTKVPPAAAHKAVHTQARSQSLEQSRARTATKRPPRFPPVALFGPNTEEHLAYRPFDDKGRPRVAAAKELSRFLRDFHTGKRHKIDPRLGRVLYEIARHYGKRLEIYSGYRPPPFSTRKHSRHLWGAAVDFRVPGVANEDVIAYLRQSFHPLGVGYYPNGVHVHVDVDRTEDTYWVDRGDDRTDSQADVPGVEEPLGDETPPTTVAATADTLDPVDDVDGEPMPAADPLPCPADPGLSLD